MLMRGRGVGLLLPSEQMSALRERGVKTMREEPEREDK